jgi:hypothetical protein|tara:strand:+ start:28 stop:141 length:114 start_codon:yes stop_codon:yes gene_type:complete
MQIHPLLEEYLTKSSQEYGVYVGISSKEFELLEPQQF